MEFLALPWLRDSWRPRRHTQTRLFPGPGPRDPGDAGRSPLTLRAPLTGFLLRHPHTPWSPAAWEEAPCITPILQVRNSGFKR